jgi:hypothetical protein
MLSLQQRQQEIGKEIDRQMKLAIDPDSFT